MCWDELLLDAVPAETGSGAGVFVLDPVVIGERGGTRREGGSAGRARSGIGTRDADVDVDATFAVSGWAGMMFTSCCEVLLR